MSINLFQCWSIPINAYQFQSMLIKQNWSVLTVFTYVLLMPWSGIDQCHDFDRHWALIEGVLFIVMPVDAFSLPGQWSRYKIKSRSSASVWLSAYAHWFQTHRRIPWTGNDTTLFQTCGFCFLLHFAKPSPSYRPLHARKLTLTCELDTRPWPRPLTLSLQQGNSDAKTRFLTFDLDLWPMTFELDLDILPLHLHAKIHLCMSVR